MIVGANARRFVGARSPAHSRTLVRVHLIERRFECEHEYEPGILLKFVLEKVYKLELKAYCIYYKEANQDSKDSS